MIPEIGSEWIARDGRKMRVDEVIIPVDQDAMPWCKMTVFNPGKRMRRHTEMSVSSLGREAHTGIPRPLPGHHHSPKSSTNPVSAS
jgi:hypothetical protein